MLCNAQISNIHDIAFFLPFYKINNYVSQNKAIIFFGILFCRFCPGRNFSVLGFKAF